MKYEYLKGSEKDFEGAPEWATLLTKTGGQMFFVEKHEARARVLNVDTGEEDKIDKSPMPGLFDNIKIIAERRPITDEADLNECIGQQSQDEFIDDFVTFGKYDRQCKGVVIDVYDVLQALEVVNPAFQHLIKKALCAGLRGHKKREQDLVEILESAKRAIELEGGK